MNKKIITLFIFALVCSILSAQRPIYQPKEYNKHEFSVGPLLGINTLNHDMLVGKSKGKFSGGVGVGYTYFFKKNMGIATGLEFSFYTADIEFNEFSSSHAAFDIDLHKDFDFRYTLNNYKETQSSFILNIPILFHYQFTDGEKVKFYGAAGVKVGFPLNGKYKASEGELVTSGYFPHNDDHMTEPRFRGFGDFDIKDYKYDSEVKYKMAFNLALEAGAKWTLPRNLALYTGLYMDYGLNDINNAKQNDLSLVQYNQISPEDHIFNGVSSSSYTTEEGSFEPLVKKVNTMAYGVKIRLAFGK